MNIRRPRRRGFALVMAVLCLTILVMVFGALSRMALAERGQARAEERRLRAGWLAEAGLERAWAKLAKSPAYSGETWALSAEMLRGRDGAIVRIAIEPLKDDPRHLKVTAKADYPGEGTSRARQTRSAIFPAKHNIKPGENP